MYGPNCSVRNSGRTLRQIFCESPFSGLMKNQPRTLCTQHSQAQHNAWEANSAPQTTWLGFPPARSRIYLCPDHPVPQLRPASRQGNTTTAQLSRNQEQVMKLLLLILSVAALSYGQSFPPFEPPEGNIIHIVLLLDRLIFTSPCPGQRCSGRNYNGRRCCTPDQPCGLGEGDCDGPLDGGVNDGHEGCKGDLVCGSNNCKKFGLYFHEKDDCCDLPSTIPNERPAPVIVPGTPLEPPAGKGENSLTNSLN